MSYLSDDGPWVFLVMTVILGGGAAFLAGRGLARSWKPFWRLFFYLALLAAAVRFFHYALFSGKLTSVYYYLVTYVILALAGCRSTSTLTTARVPRRWSFIRRS